jgi:L-fucose isomerase-like protein
LEKPSVFLIPIASMIHVERVPGPIIRARALLDDAGLTVYGPRRPIRKIEEFPSTKSEEFDSVVIFVASGGIGGMISQLVSNKKWFLWAYHENNSLPSALSAREKMMAEKAWKGELVYNNLSEAPKEIVAEAFATKTLKVIRSSKIGFAADDEEFREVDDVIKFLKGFFGLDTVLIPIEKLRSTLKSVPKEAAQQVVKDRLKQAEILESSSEDIEKSVKLYLALKSFVEEMNLNGVTIDCFKFLKQTGITPCLAMSFLNDDGVQGICEADLLAAPLMLIFNALTGNPPWIANTGKLDQINGLLTLAHCTAATKLCEPAGVIRVRHHFESGMGASLDVPLKKGKVTLAHLSLNPPNMVIVNGEITESQMGHWKLCRTQADVKLNCNLDEFLQKSGNHQILGYGDYAPILVRIADKLNIKYTFLK